jgi:subtilisin family serine protease
MKTHGWFRICLIVVFLLCTLIYIKAAIGSTRSSGIKYNTGPALQQENWQPGVVPGVVVVKIKSGALSLSMSKADKSTGISSLDATLRQLNVVSVGKMFRHKPIPHGSGIPDISRILKIRIPEYLDPVRVAHELEKDPHVEYAEPVYVRQLCAVPNDARYFEQHYLLQIQAPEAWDVQKGDSTVVIAIVDNGVDYKHEDLTANVWTNEPEASGVTGVDDDGNGFVDDIHGWDFGNDDADPIGLPTTFHGTHCAGIASAVTNNQIGIAGSGWNCEFMPVKVSADDTPDDMPMGFEGITYAADNGADVISCSWGFYGYSRWEQECVNYAYRKGAVIICCAQNLDAEGATYPASYQNVISVAAVKSDDTKANYSNYGPWIDICAPGGDEKAGILSTMPNNEYASFSGTSMATPIVAGVCGLVKSLHPDWSTDQVIRQVLLTADNIDALNPQYSGKLGHGRLNALQALIRTDLQEPDARLVVFSYTIRDSLNGNDNGVPEQGETIQLHCDIQNCSIGGSETASFQLSCNNAGIEILDGFVGPVVFPADTILPVDFNVKVSEDALMGQAELVLTSETGKGYSHKEQIQIAIGIMPLLFVDNDQLFPAVPNSESFYCDILDQNQVLYGYWNAQQLGFPGSDILLNFPIVILNTQFLGNFGNTYEEINVVKQYLDSGGHLLICGQDIAAVLAEAYGTEEALTTLHDYLHAEYLTGESGNLQITGVPGHAIGHDLSFHVFHPGWPADWQAPDVIAPAEGASSVFTFSDGRTAAVCYSGAHKVVYLAFGLEAVDSYPTTQPGDISPIRSELLMRILNWLSFIEHEPLADTENTDSSRMVMAKITPNVTEAVDMTLFWRVHGMNDFTIIPMVAADSDRFSAEIPAQDSGATVDYYMQAELPSYNWTSPVGAPDTVYSYHVGVGPSRVETSNLPVEFRLKHNYPNPFNPTTTIEYDLLKADNIRLVIYDILGRQVKTLVDGRQSAGHYRTAWDGTDDCNLPVAAGLYFCRMETGDFVKTIKLAMVR